MDLVLFFQEISNSFLSFFFSIFNVFGGLEFALFVFAILFLVVNKSIGYKYFLSSCFGFFIGTVFIKNTVRRLRPYDVNTEIITNKSCYSYSLPSNSAIISANTSFATLWAVKNNYKKQKVFNKFAFSFIVFFAVLYCALAGVAKIYFAHNFLLDVIVGLALGFIVSTFIFKHINITLKTKKIFAVIFGIACLALFCYFAKDFNTNNFNNALVFEFCGACLSILIGSLIEEKYIKYQIKNNPLIVVLKTLILVVLFLGFYFLSYILPGLLIITFIKPFVIGCVVTMLLPLLFSKIQKYCYIFSNKVKEEKTVEAVITLSEKGTIKFCKRIKDFVKDGDCFLLEGDLGSGKSFIVRTLLNEFGVHKRITSPTFTLFNDYTTNSRHFYHFDLYRLEDENEVTNIGFEEIMDDKTSIKFIEWPDNAKKFMPKQYKKITIVKLGKKARNIILEDYT